MNGPPSHAQIFSVPAREPAYRARCSHVVKCRCGSRILGSGNTKEAARNRAETAYEKHVKDEAARARAVAALFVEDEL